MLLRSFSLGLIRLSTSAPTATEAAAKATENKSTGANRLVFEVLDEKRGFRSGESLKAYLKAQFKANTIAVKDNVGSAVDKMLKNDVSFLVVVDEQLKLAGVLSDRDYIKFRRTTPASITDEATLVSKIMIPDYKVISVSLETTERDAVNIMLKNNIRHLPVFHGENKKLHGILSFQDFLTEPSRFDTTTIRALFGEHDVDVFVDDYSFSLTDTETVKIKERIAEASKRLNLKKE